MEPTPAGHAGDAGDARLGRRTFLRATAAAVVATPALAGCTVDWHGPGSEDGDGTPAPGPSPSPGATGGATGGAPAAESAAGTPSEPATPRRTEPDPDVTLVGTALAGEQRLLDTYAAAAKRHRQIRARLRPVRARQQRHVEALRSAVTPSPEQQPPASHPRIPTHPRKAVAVLAQAVTAAEDARLTDCGHAQSGALAALLASIAASHRATAGQVTQWGVHKPGTVHSGGAR